MSDLQLSSLFDTIMLSRLQFEFMLGIARAAGQLFAALAAIGIGGILWLAWRLLRRYW